MVLLLFLLLVLLVLLLVLVSIVFYLFWGPLFPWNPVKIGYTKISSSKATIYVNDITENDTVVYRIQEIIKKEEEFHDLHYVDNFKIVVLNKESNNKRPGDLEYRIEKLKATGFILKSDFNTEIDNTLKFCQKSFCN